MKKLATVLLFLSVALSSCYEEETDIPLIGYEFFPMEVGRFVEYQVDSLWRDDAAGPIAFSEIRYRLRDVNESTFTDEEGRTAMRVERSWRKSGEIEFRIKDIWSRTRTDQFAEQNEENVIFVKMDFPIREGKVWNGNRRTTLTSLQEHFRQPTIPQEWDYTFQNVNEPYAINGFTFDSTVTVMQADRPAQFGLNMFAKEVYAKNIGLVHKQMDIFDVQQNQGNPNDRDTLGFFFEMVVTDFGP